MSNLPSHDQIITQQSDSGDQLSKLSGDRLETAKEKETWQKIGVDCWANNNSGKLTGSNDAVLPKLDITNSSPAEISKYLTEVLNKSASERLLDSVKNRQEEKDAEEFDKKFGKNPNSPEAVAWVKRKIEEHANSEADQAFGRDEKGNGVLHPKDCGFQYGQALLLAISAKNHTFKAENVSWSYFQYGAGSQAGWRGMNGFRQQK